MENKIMLSSLRIPALYIGGKSEEINQAKIAKLFDPNTFLYNPQYIWVERALIKGGDRNFRNLIIVGENWKSYINNVVREDNEDGSTDFYLEIKVNNYYAKKLSELEKPVVVCTMQTFFDKDGNFLEVAYPHYELVQYDEFVDREKKRLEAKRNKTPFNKGSIVPNNLTASVKDLTAGKGGTPDAALETTPIITSEFAAPTQPLEVEAPVAIAQSEEVHLEINQNFTLDPDPVAPVAPVEPATTEPVASVVEAITPAESVAETIAPVEPAVPAMAEYEQIEVKPLTQTPFAGLADSLKEMETEITTKDEAKEDLLSEISKVSEDLKKEPNLKKFAELVAASLANKLGFAIS